MKSLVYLLLMLLSAAISDAPENEKSKDESSSKCLKARTSCTAKTVCSTTFEQHKGICTKPEEVS